MPDSAITARSLHGRLCLCFGRRGDRSVLLRAERTPPLHVGRMQYLDGAHPSLATASILNQTAGLFAGDRLSLHIQVDADAAVTLGTPAMTRVFAMCRDQAEVETSIHVAEGGYLEYLPEPVLLCRDAALRQSLIVDAAAGARAACGEVIAFGRAARGERGVHRAFRQRTRFAYGGAPVLAEMLEVGTEIGPDSVGLLGGAAALGSLNMLAGRAGSPDLLVRTRVVLGEHELVRAGASLLAGDAGVGVRVLGDAAHPVQAALRSVMALFRQAFAP